MRSLQKVLHIQNFQLYNFIFWTMLCMLDFFRSQSLMPFANSNLVNNQLLIWTISKYIIYWLLSYWVFDLYLKSRQKKKTQFILYHAVTGLVYAIVHKVLSDLCATLLERLFLGSEHGNFEDTLKQLNSIMYDIPINYIFYWGIIVILLGLDYYRKFVNEHTRFIEMEAQLSRAQLESLKMQLNPHFLFNAFNTISMMVRIGRTEPAVKMISGLSDMLRQSLSTDSRQFVDLKDEIELLKKYLMLESERYRDRLTVEWDIDESLLGCKVPSLILQPIVENAFKHGISRNRGKSVLRITIRRVDSGITMEVFNNGSYLPINWDINSSKGVGLANTINRLIRLYQQDYKIQISEKNEGVSVIIKIPYITDMDVVSTDRNE